MKLTLPWPPKEISPNFKRRSHWRRSVKPTRDYRTACWALALEAKAGIAAADVPVMLKITFYPPDNRRRDRDSMIGAFKAGQDGLADALKTDDNLFRPTYEFGNVVKGGSVEVEIL